MTMTSKKDVYTWIADYACKHRLEDIIGELFHNLDTDVFYCSKISRLNLKHAIVWMVVENDCQEDCEEAVDTVDSLLEEAITSCSLEFYTRLSIGLRIKDLSHCLSQPLDILEQKLNRYFPDSKFHIDKKYLTKVFPASELQNFEEMVANICKYFRTLMNEEAEKMNLMANYPQSQLGNILSEGIKTVTGEFFDKLSQNQPLNKLEQIVKFGVEKDNSSSPWHAWLVDRLSGVHTLNGDVIRDLLTSLRWHEAVSPVNQENVIKDSRRNSMKRALASEAKHDDRPVKKVVLHKTVEHSSEDSYQGDDSASSDQTNCVTLVPSSQGELDISNNEMWNGCKKRTYCENYSIPNLQQFLKPGGIRGCVVKLQRI